MAALYPLAHGIFRERARVIENAGISHNSPPSSPHARKRIGHPAHMHLAGADLALAAAAKREEVNWWWTSVQQYNQRGCTSNYSEAQLSRPYKIGAEDARLSGALLQNRLSGVLSSDPHKVYRQLDPQVYLHLDPKMARPPKATSNTCLRRTATGMIPPVSALPLFKTRRPSYTGFHEVTADPYTLRSSEEQAERAAKMSVDMASRSRSKMCSPSKQLSAGHSSGLTMYGFRGQHQSSTPGRCVTPQILEAPYRARSHTVPPAGGRNLMPVERLGPATPTMKPPAPDPEAAWFSNINQATHKPSTPFRNMRGMNLTPAMLQPLPGTPILEPRAMYRVPSKESAKARAAKTTNSRDHFGTVLFAPSQTEDLRYVPTFKSPRTYETEALPIRVMSPISRNYE